MRGRADVGLRYVCLPDSGGRRNNPDAFPAKAHFTSGGNLNMGANPRIAALEEADPLSYVLMACAI